MKHQPIPCKPPVQHAKDPLCVEYILERHHGIVGEPDKGTSALETWSHLELEPFIQHVAQETIFQDACLQPLINHPSDDTIRDSPVKKVSKVRVRYRIKIFFDVDIDHPPQSLAHKARTEILQRLMSRATAPESE